MHDFDGFEDDSSSTVFRDVVMLALAGFVVLVLLLPHLKSARRQDRGQHDAARQRNRRGALAR
jgi:hypothetical protein